MRATKDRDKERGNFIPGSHDIRMFGNISRNFDFDVLSRRLVIILRRSDPVSIKYGGIVVKSGKIQDFF